MERLTFANTTTLQGRTLSGIAHAFGSVTQRGGHSIAFSAAAFAEALRGSDVYAFVSHDTGRILGHEKAGTVRLSMVPEGLAYEIDLPDTTDGRDTATLVERGDLNSMSFGVVPGKYTTSTQADGKQLRTYQSCSLFDISPVALPAFAGTTVQLHAADVTDAERTSQLIRARVSGRSK
jgi:HK97 family phage prohead protease